MSEALASTVRKPTVAVVIPTYNERENIASLVTSLLDLDSLLRVLIVDDNSPDGTGEVADTLAHEYPGML